MCLDLALATPKQGDGSTHSIGFTQMSTIQDFILQDFKTEKHVHPHSQKSLQVLGGLQFCLKLPPEPGDAPEDPSPVGGQDNLKGSYLTTLDWQEGLSLAP